MKKLFFFVSVALLITAVGCNKNNLPETETPEGVQMTITATIDDPTTRITATDDEAGRKLTFAWEAGDKISVISVNSSGVLIANDIFTATAGGSTADFTGTFTGGASADKVVVFYPALTESYEESSVTKWRVPSENGYSDCGILEGLSDVYIRIRGWYYLQTALDSPSHLKNYMILRGEADIAAIKTNTLAVNLEHMTTVLKLKLTLPSPGINIESVDVEMKKADDSPLVAVGLGWGYISQLKSFPLGGSSNNADLCLGSSIVSGTGTGLTVTGTEATFYIPFVLNTQGASKYSFTSGQKFVVHAYSGTKDYSEEKIFTANKDLEPGKLYTINSAPLL